MSTVLFAFGDELRALDDVLHRAAAADDAVVVELLVALVDQVPVMGAQTLVLERAARDDEQLVDFEGLLQEIERAELHRLDGALDGRVRRHHQDLRPLALRRRADELADEVEPDTSGIRLSRSARSNAAPASSCARRVRPCGLGHAVPVGPERPAERLQDLVFIVDEQDRAGLHGSDVPCTMHKLQGHADRCGSRGAPCGSYRLRRRQGVIVIRHGHSVHLHCALCIVVCTPPGRVSTRRVLVAHGDGPAQALDDVAGDRQAEARAGPAGGEVRLEDARRARDAIPLPWSRTVMCGRHRRTVLP